MITKPKTSKEGKLIILHKPTTVPNHGQQWQQKSTMPWPRPTPETQNGGCQTGSCWITFSVAFFLIEVQHRHLVFPVSVGVGRCWRWVHRDGDFANLSRVVDWTINARLNSLEKSYNISLTLRVSEWLLHFLISPISGATVCEACRALRAMLLTATVNSMTTMLSLKASALNTISLKHERLNNVSNVIIPAISGALLAVDIAAASRFIGV
jgi:hypothetical protein